MMKLNIWTKKKTYLCS